MIFILYKSLDGRSIHAMPSKYKSVAEAEANFKRVNPFVRFLDCWEVADN